jgi:hypothetical protein
MLTASFAILSLTVGLGACLAAGRLHRMALIHGLSGAAGLVFLLLALRAHALRGPFATDAAALAGLALLGGGALAAFTWRGLARPALVVLLHGLAGGLAYLLLAGFVLNR